MPSSSRKGQCCISDQFKVYLNGKVIIYIYLAFRTAYANTLPFKSTVQKSSAH